MSDLFKAAADARLLLKGFKAFAEVAEALEAAGQIEQRTVEATKLLAELQPAVEAAKAEVARAKGAAAQHVDRAKEQASKVIADAEAKAADVVTRLAEQVKLAEAAANDTLAERKSAAVVAMAERDGALVNRNALLKECEALEARLAKAQASIAKLLG
jgi:DNA polymerase I-like protein with 3'-5' exonuclease and polymerase domains